MNDITSALRPAFVLILVFAALTGLAYPLAMTGIGQALFPAQANGSLIVDDGKVVGSALVGQSFASARYFHSRPSAAGTAGYDAKASSGSNLGPTSKALVDRVKTDVSSIRASGVTGAIPTDLVTTSASGLDPDISPEAAFAQAGRVARERGLDAGRVSALVRDAVQGPIVGVIGEPRVNVLLLNRQLDALSAKPAG